MYRKTIVTLMYRKTMVTLTYRKTMVTQVGPGKVEAGCRVCIPAQGPG